MSTAHDSQVLKEKYLQQAHQLLIKPTEKPRANVEPFVHSVQPRHKPHPKKEHHSTPLCHAPSHHGNGDPYSYERALTDRLTTAHLKGVRIHHTPQQSLGGTKEPPQFADTSFDKREFPYPTTSTPVTRHTDHTSTLHKRHTPTRLFTLPTPDPTPANPSCQHCPHFEEKVKFLTEANKELKRLLVASLGNDLKLQLEQLIHEKAAMSCDLNSSLRQLADNLELVDKVTIDCDVWRSKFYASRLMIDELAGVKKEVSQQLGHSQRALQCLLEERARLGHLLDECTAMLDRGGAGSEILCPSVDGTRPPTGVTHPPIGVTVVDLATRTRHLIQLHCGHTHYEEGGAPTAGDPAHTIEPTPGERMAQQALSSQQKDVLLPPKLKESDITRQQWVRSHDLVAMSHDLVLGGAVDFRCAGCKGPLLFV